MSSSSKCLICTNRILGDGGDLFDVSSYSDKTLFQILEFVTGQTVQITSTRLCDRCTNMLNHHDKFSMKVKTIQDRLNNLMDQKNLEAVEKIEISDDDDEKVSPQREKKEKFKCSTCQKTFVHRAVYRLHLESHKKVPDEFGCNIMCERCGATFATQKSFALHKRDCTDEPLKCEVEGCEREFDTYDRLRRHKYKHKRKPITVNKEPCEFCGKEFQKGYVLMMHRKIHLNLRDNKCPLCPSRFNQMKNLRSHVKTNHPENYFVHESKNHFLDELICPHCPTRVKTMTLYVKHFESDHPEYLPSNDQ